jgi:hypothetical protein
VRGDHGLGAGSGVAAEQAVDVEGRPRPDPFQRRAPGFPDRRLDPCAGQELRLVERQRRPLLGLLEFEHPVVEARKLHPPLTIVELASTRQSTFSGFGTAPPYMPECRSREGPRSFSSTYSRPRSMVEIAG